MFEEKNLLAFRITAANQYLGKGTTYSLFSSLYVITTYVLGSCGPKAEPQIWCFPNYLGVQE